MANGLVKFQGNTYDLVNNQAQTGQQKIDNNWYLFDKNSGAMQTGFRNLAPYDQNKECYYN